ncbi:site-specific integrase [Variovorax sp. GrIS 2.14]|uniref:site-specific integrase n=1 Tax=Variovorax sp. GrIS 2.14 TaxID=3071709 RepID=UPI0038F65D89
MLKSRHGVYYLRNYRDGREVRTSLRTKEWATAKLLALHFHLGRAMPFRKLDLTFPSGFEIKNVNTAEDFERLKELLANGSIQQFLSESSRQIEEVRASLCMPPSGAVHASQQAPGAPVKARTKIFSEVVSLYLAEKKLDNTRKTIEEKQSTYNEYARLFSDSDINALGDEPAVSFKNRMVSDGAKAPSINKKMSYMKDLFSYAINNKLYFGSNPFDKLGVSNKAKLRAATQSYLAFSDKDLKLIFENPGYAEFMNEPDYLWVPFLGLYTGARIETLANLRVSQIQEDGGIWYLDIVKDKNLNSVRQVPLHERVVESGFLKYVEKVKAAGHVQLFPHILPGKNGYSRNCSRRFGQYLEKVGIMEQRKVFHSFRGTFISRMTNLGVHPAVLMGLVGHYEQKRVDFSSPHFTNYQEEVKPLHVFKAAIDRLSFDIQFSAH